MTRTARDEEIRSLLILDGLPGVGPRALRSIVERAGSARGALRGRRAAIVEVAGREVAAAAADPEARAGAGRALEAARRGGMRIVTWKDSGYPPRLRELADPPPLLFLRGDHQLLGEAGVTVVGSRRASARGRRVAHALGAALGRAGAVVISGMALGIDGAAHEGALAAGGRTVAVLGCGADRAYPRVHTPLFARILEHGLAVTEFPPGTRALPHHFPRRNRILAALARVVVVVEAGRRSGALITVEHALDLGIDVYAVPGPIDEDACAGSNALLRDGAKPLLSIQDFVAQTAGLEGPVTGPAAGMAEGDEAAVLEALDAGSADASAVARRAGLDLSRSLALLAALEIRGWVEKLPGMRYRRVA